MVRPTNFTIHSHSHPKMENWTSSGSLPKDTPMTWLKANFKPPPGKEPVVVDLLGMGVKWQKRWPFLAYTNC
ncbi:hypothetical protein Pint_13546 [Pistacia integerrima]|uniref:Uncharacterized protein n=1 Tax=Pistacia integerrima TaxID=434235 RepID=A0ACC0Y6K3_9ROSI|nr:hypothetical protein Pint_13546 [Pistacia integerrima]